MAIRLTDFKRSRLTLEFNECRTNAVDFDWICPAFFDSCILINEELLVQLHFKAFLVKLRKARVQYLRSVPDDILGHLSTL